MTQSATPATDREASVGRLNYLDSSIPSSLYRNGKMLLRRNADGLPPARIVYRWRLQAGQSPGS